MSSRRLLKAAEAIREVVASSILTEIRDPRVQDVTVLRVDVSPDMREAKVSVTVMGSEQHQRLAIRGLQNAAGFLQSKIARRIETRYTPRLHFTLDKGAQNAMVVGEILAKIKQEKTTDEILLEDESAADVSAADVSAAEDVVVGGVSTDGPAADATSADQEPGSTHSVESSTKAPLASPAATGETNFPNERT